MSIRTQYHSCLSYLKNIMINSMGEILERRGRKEAYLWFAVHLLSQTLTQPQDSFLIFFTENLKSAKSIPHIRAKALPHSFFLKKKICAVWKGSEGQLMNSVQNGFENGFSRLQEWLQQELTLCVNVPSFPDFFPQELYNSNGTEKPQIIIA